MTASEREVCQPHGAKGVNVGVKECQRLSLRLTPSSPPIHFSPWQTHTRQIYPLLLLLPAGRVYQRRRRPGHLSPCTLPPSIPEAEEEKEKSLVALGTCLLKKRGKNHIIIIIIRAYIKDPVPIMTHMVSQVIFSVP